MLVLYVHNLIIISAEEVETQVPGVYLLSKPSGPFGFQFGKHVAATTPGNIVDSRPSNSIYGISEKLSSEEALKKALQNVIELTQNGLISQKSNKKSSLPISPCIFSTSDVYIKNCRPEGTVPIPGFWSQVCPEGSFCQVAESLQQSICCPKTGGNPCHQKKNSGVGTSQLKRWFYDPESHQCKGFIFNGFQVSSFI